MVNFDKPELHQNLIIIDAVFLFVQILEGDCVSQIEEGKFW